MGRGVERGEELAGEDRNRMELGIVKPVGIVDQMTEAYLDYSMSVIVSPCAARRA